MKASSLALCAAGLLTGLAARAQTPYVETTTLTFYWGFATGYQTNVAGQTPTLPDVSTFDPETLPDGWQSYTDTLRTLPYTGPAVGQFAPAGGNKQIIDMLLQRAVREGRVFKEELPHRWQLIAVREAPRNVRELATNPYRIFLAGQLGVSSLSIPVEASPYSSEPADDDPLPPTYLDTDLNTDSVTVDTGITLTLGAFSGTYNESKWNATEDKVSKASGKVSTAFTVNFGALFYEDPLHAQDKPDTSPFNYHLRRNYWQASASGWINYNIRSTPAPLPTFIATGAGATGTGWFRHERDETEYKDGVPVVVDNPLKTYSGAGIAPLKVVMSSIQYQKRDRFPDLVPPRAPFGLQANATSATQVDLSWFDISENETAFELERSVGTPDAWSTLATIPTNDVIGDRFGDEEAVDATVVADTTYFYRVRAINANGASAYSAIVQVTPQTPEP